MRSNPYRPLSKLDVSTSIINKDFARLLHDFSVLFTSHLVLRHKKATKDQCGSIEKKLGSSDSTNKVAFLKQRPSQLNQTKTRHQNQKHDGSRAHVSTQRDRCVTSSAHPRTLKRAAAFQNRPLFPGEACHSPVVGLIPKMALKPKTCMVIHTYFLRRPTKKPQYSIGKPSSDLTTCVTSSAFTQKMQPSSTLAT